MVETALLAGRGRWSRSVHRPVADGSGHDRQLLVVGRGPAALAAAGFLDQAGLDPVLAGGAESRPGPATATLWQPGLELLERLGLRRPTEETATPLSALRCLEPSRTWAGSGTACPPLVALRRTRLVTLMEHHLLDRLRTADRRCLSVRPTDAGVRATFEGGVTEPFDAVVTADPTLVPDRHVTDRSTPVHWWSFDWPETVRGPDGAAEAWGTTRAAFGTPVDGTVRVDLVATDHEPTPLSPAQLSEAFGELAGTLSSAVAEVDESTLRYGRLAHAVPRTPGIDHVALVGPAAHATIPGDCLGPALAVEDGWVLADALAYGPEAVGDALGTYASRRHARMATIGSTLRDEALTARIPGELTGVLRDLCARRTLAFDHLFGAAGGELTRGIPERL